MKKKMLFTNSFKFNNADKDLGKKFDLIFTPVSDEEHLLPLIQDVHGIIAHNTEINDTLIKAAPLLEVISTPQVGYEKIDLAAATEAGVAVIANLGVGARSVAEFTLGLMIALSRRIVRANSELHREKNWSARIPYLKQSLEMGSDLYQTNLGLVGFGAIGRAVALMCQATFCAHIMAYDPFVSKENMAQIGVEKQERLVDMVGKVDFLSIHAALNADAKHLINENIFRAMKPDAFLINCARGSIIDESALVKALNQKWIAGAAIDVFEEEPLNSENPLLKMDNIILTPHIAGITKQSSLQRKEILVKGILDAFAGDRPEGLVNAEVWSRFLKRIDK